MTHFQKKCFLGRKTKTTLREMSHSGATGVEKNTPWLGSAGLLVLPCLGLVWPGPVLSALPWLVPATTTAAAQPPPAAEGGRLLLLLDQAKAKHARQAQARPSQGKAQQASQPSQGLNSDNCFDFFLICHFNPQGSGGRWPSRT